jgi:AcrR family transcriptional regulator
MEADDRRAQLISTGLKIAQKVGWRKVTRKAVAEKTDTVEALINRYFGNKEGFRDALMVEAVALKLVPIVAEGILYHNEAALKAPATLRREAKSYIEKHQMALPRWRIVTENGVVHAWA